MTAVYETTATDRLGVDERRDVLRVDFELLNELRRTGAVVTLTAPVDLERCSACPEDGGEPLNSEAVVVYRSRDGRMTYAEPVDRECGRHLIRWLRDAGSTVLRIEQPVVAA